VSCRLAKLPLRFYHPVNPRCLLHQTPQRTQCEYQIRCQCRGVSIRNMNSTAYRQVESSARPIIYPQIVTVAHRQSSSRICFWLIICRTSVGRYMIGGLVISLGGELHGVMFMTQTQTDDDNDTNANADRHDITHGTRRLRAVATYLHSQMATTCKHMVECKQYATDPDHRSFSTQEVDRWGTVMIVAVHMAEQYRCISCFSKW